MKSTFIKVWSLITGGHYTPYSYHMYICNSASSNCVGNTICTTYKYNIAWCVWAGENNATFSSCNINSYNFGIVKAMDFLWMYVLFRVRALIWHYKLVSFEPFIGETDEKLIILEH